MKKLKVSLILLLLVNLTSAAYAVDVLYRCEPKHVYKLIDNGSLKEITNNLDYVYSSNEQPFYINTETGRIFGRVPSGFGSWNTWLKYTDSDHTPNVKIVNKGVDGNWFKSLYFDKRNSGEVYTLFIRGSDGSSGPFAITGQSLHDEIRTGTCSGI